jgi:membrane protease YdiL (CAAX protease family)
MILSVMAVTAILVVPVTAVLSMLDPSLTEEELLDSPLLLFLGITLQGLAGLFLVYFVAVRRGVTSWSEMRLTGPRARNWFWRGLGWAVVFLLVSIVIEVVQSSLFGIRVSQPEFQAIQETSVAGQIAIWVAGVGMAPLSEEILFRGFLLRAIASRKGIIRGIIYSSALFALLHVNPAAGLENAGIFLPVFAGACLIGIAYRRSNDLLVPITAHALNNALAFSVLLLGV